MPKEPRQGLGAALTKAASDDSLARRGEPRMRPQAGPPRRPSQHDADGEPVDEAALRDWLVDFYVIHNPGKLASLEALREKYRGREQALVAQLERKYASGGPSERLDADDDDESSVDLPEAERDRRALEQTRAALRTQWTETVALRQAITRAGALAGELADCRAALDEQADAFKERQAEHAAAALQHKSIADESEALRKENRQLRDALGDAERFARGAKRNFCAPLDQSSLGDLDDASLAALFAAAAAALPAAAAEQKRRLDATRERVLCVSCGAAPRTKMAAACGHLLFCGDCAPAGASTCPLCDVVILADQWTHVRT